MFRGGGLSAALAGALIAACSPTVEPGPPPQPTALATAAPTVEATSAPVASAAPRPTVACGEATCVVGEQICCATLVEGGAARCMPAAEAESCYEQGEGRTVQACDEAADCGAGAKCCRASTETDEARTSCAPKCPDYEVCGRAGTCSAGHACIGDLLALPGGRCVRKDIRVHCGSDVCEGDKPWCRYDPETQLGQCISHFDGQSAPELVFQCSADRDCSDEQRCFVVEGHSFCGGTADFAKHGDASFFCETIDDCPQDKRFVYTCEPAERLPLGLKLCVRGDPL